MVYTVVYVFFEHFFLIWCLGQVLLNNCVGSWLLPFHLLCQCFYELRAQIYNTAILNIFSLGDKGLHGSSQLSKM